MRHSMSHIMRHDMGYGRSYGASHAKKYAEPHILNMQGNMQPRMQTRNIWIMRLASSRKAREFQSDSTSPLGANQAPAPKPAAFTSSQQQITSNKQG